MENKTYHLDDIIGDSQDKSTVTIDNPPTAKEEVSETPVKKAIITPKDVGNSMQFTKSTDDASVKAQSVEAGKLIKSTPKKDAYSITVDKEMKLIDDAIERDKQRILKERIEPLRKLGRKVMEEKALNGELTPAKEDLDITPTGDKNSDVKKDESDKTSSNTINSDGTTTVYTATPYTEVDDKPKDTSISELDQIKALDIDRDLDDDEEVLDDEDTDTSKESDTSEDAVPGEVDVDKLSPEERKAYFIQTNKDTEMIREKLNAGSTLDLSTFKISNNPIAVTKAIQYAADNAKASGIANTAAVPLVSTGKMIRFRALSGSDIAAISPGKLDDGAESVRNVFAVIYQHVVDDNKPVFSEWLRSISSSDFEQLYFGLYKATYEGSNYLPYTCPICNTFFMTENVPIDNMQRISKNASKEAKERLEKIVKHGQVDDTVDKRQVLYAVSDSYAITIHPLTLYDLLQANYLDEKYTKKYELILGLAQVIGKVYYIDHNKNTLVPIDTKPDPKSISKTFRHKCAVVHEMVNSINADQYGLLNSKIADIASNEAMYRTVFEYFMPEQKCLGSFKTGEHAGQKCTHTIKEQPLDPYAMLFTRHLLARRNTLPVE